jgi:hypothetical protein
MQGDRAIVFLRSLVRFAWDDLSGFTDPVEALRTSFTGSIVRIGVGIGTPFSRETVGWYIDDPVIGGKDVTMMEPLFQLQQEIRRDLEMLGKACRSWDMDMAALGRLRRFPKKIAWPYFVEVPWELCFKLNQYLPRYSLHPTGELVPVSGGGLEKALYFGLIHCIQRGLLLRCGTCSFCGRLVVHERQPRKPLSQCFCREAGRDCKTAFHNARKATTRDGRRPGRKRQPRRRESDVERSEIVRQEPGILALKGLAMVAASRDREHEVGRLVKRLLGASSASEAWRFIDQIKKSQGDDGELRRCWRRLSPPAQNELIQWHSRSQGL